MNREAEIPMRQSGADCFVVLMKRRNGRGGKGAARAAFHNALLSIRLEVSASTNCSEFISQLSVRQRLRIEAACVDMWEPFKTSIQEIDSGFDAVLEFRCFISGSFTLVSLIRT